MKRYSIDDLVPPWVDGRKHADNLYTGFLFAAILSCFLFGTVVFLQTYPSPSWSSFHEFLGLPIFFPFTVLELASVNLAVVYYQGFTQGSNARLLMKRLPDRWELARRCLTLPLITIALCLLSILLLTLLFFALYLVLAPEGSLSPGQTELLLRNLYRLFLPNTLIEIFLSGV